MVKDIVIKDKEQVEKINKLATRAPYEVWVSDKTVMLDARSLLGLFSLIGKKAHIVAEDSVDPKAFAKLVSKMA